MTHLGAAKGRRPRTLETYGLALTRLREFLAGKPLVLAEPAELEAFAGMWLHKRGVVARSRKPYVSAVRGFFGWLHRRGHVRRNAAAELPHPKTGRPLPSALSLVHAEKLMWAPDLGTFAGMRDAAMLSLLMGCGMRVSGLVALNEGDLRTMDLGGKPRLIVRLTEKGEKQRDLPVPREAEMLLRVYLDHEELKGFERDVVDGKGRPDKLLFVNTRNTRVPADQWRGEAVRMGRKSVWRLIQRYGTRLGIPERELHPHAFRHLVGVQLAEGEEDLLVRQDILGHIDPKSTEIYTALAMGRKARVLDRAGPLGQMKTPVTELLKRM